MDDIAVGLFWHHCSVVMPNNPEKEALLHSNRE
jgi:hypothetical protein